MHPVSKKSDPTLSGASTVNLTSDVHPLPIKSQNNGVLPLSSVGNTTSFLLPPKKLVMPEASPGHSLRQVAYNINTAHIPSAPPAVITLNHAVPTPKEKMALYSEYLHYGQNLADVQAMMNGLEAMLTTEGMKNIHHTAQITAVLPALNSLTKTLLTQEVREKKTQAQLQNVNKNENVVRELISAFAILPDILLKTDSTTINKSLSDCRKALMDELAQSALKRLLTGTESENKRLAWEKEIKAIICKNSQNIKIRERLVHFLASNYKRLQEPVKKGLTTSVQQIEHAVRIANRDIIQPEKNIHTLLSTIAPKAQHSSFVRDIAEVTTALDEILSALKLSIKNMSEFPTGTIEPHHEADKWCYPDGIHLSVLLKKVVGITSDAIRPAEEGLRKFYRDKINHQRLAPFLRTSFSSLSPSDKMWCLKLKDLAAPLLTKAEQLERAANQLKSAIKDTLSAGIQTLAKPETAEEALLTELTIHTQDTPQVRLTNAIQEAQALAQHILSEPTVAVGTSLTLLTTEQQKKEKKFSDIVQDVSGSLDDAARCLQETARLMQSSVGKNEDEARLTAIESSLEKAAKMARHAQDILLNGLDSVTGVRRHDKYEWIHKLGTDIRKNWQGITHLLRKSYHPYHLTSNKNAQNAEKKAFYHQLHQGIFPLLNEAEKLIVGSRRLEMALILRKKNGDQGQSAVNLIAEQCRKIDPKDIQKLWGQVSPLFSKRDIPLYQIGDEQGKHPLTLGSVLNKFADSLQKRGQILQDVSWNAQWAPDGEKTRLVLTELSSQLEGIKAGIKDAVEAVTGTRVHNNPPEGMIVKDAGEWLMELKQEYAKMAIPAKEANDTVAEIVNHLCQTFTTKDDPDGKMFRHRVELAMKDAENGGIAWPLTAEEHLARTKSRKDYTLAWAEKSLTYRAGAELLLNHSLAGMFSPVKHSLIAPLRLLNLMLTPIKMEMTCRGMEKVRPGNTIPTSLTAKYKSREYFQLVSRLISMLLPQLPKTIAATAIVGYGLNEGGEYRDKFLCRAASRLPADMFWISGFAAGREIAKAIDKIGRGEIEELTAKQAMDKTEVYAILQRGELQSKNSHMNTNTEKQLAIESFEPKSEKSEFRGGRGKRDVDVQSNDKTLNQQMPVQGFLINKNNMQSEERLRLTKENPELAENINTLPNHIKKNGIKQEATQLDVPYRGFWEKKWDKNQHSELSNKWYDIGHKAYLAWKVEKIKYLEMIGRHDLVPSALNYNKSDFDNLNLGKPERAYDPTYRRYFHQDWDDEKHSESENKVFKNARKQYLEFRAEKLSQYIRGRDAHEKINSMSSEDKLFLTEENPELAEKIEMLKDTHHREEQGDTKSVVSSPDVPLRGFWERKWDKSQHSEFANKWHEIGYNSYLAWKAKKTSYQDLMPSKSRSNIPPNNAHAPEHIDGTASGKTSSHAEEHPVKAENINAHQNHSDPDGQSNTNPIMSSLDIPYREYWEKKWDKSQHSEHENKVHEIGYNAYSAWKARKINSLAVIGRTDLMTSVGDAANINKMSAGDKFILEKEDPSLYRNIEMLKGPSHKIRQRDINPVFTHLDVPHRAYWEKIWDENEHSDFANKWHEAGYNAYLAWKENKVKYLEGIGRHELIPSISRGDSPANVNTMSLGDKLFLTEENPELAENIEMLKDTHHREEQGDTKSVVSSPDVPLRGFWERKWDKSQHSEFANKWHEIGYNSYLAWKAKKTSYQDLMPSKSRSNIPPNNAHAPEHIDGTASGKTSSHAEEHPVKAENINAYQNHSDPDGQSNTNPIMSSLDIPYREYWEKKWDKSQHSEHENKVHEIGYNAYSAWKARKINSLAVIGRTDLMTSVGDTANINKMSAGDKFILEKEDPSLYRNIEMLKGPSHKIRQRDINPVFTHLDVPHRAYWEKMRGENEHSDFANKWHEAGYNAYLAWKEKKVKYLEGIGRHELIPSISRGDSPANVNTMSLGDKLFLTEENPELAENIEMLKDTHHREEQGDTKSVVSFLDVPLRGFWERKWNKSQHSEFANKWHDVGYKAYLAWKAKKIQYLEKIGRQDLIRENNGSPVL
ncbi:hypothetical protein [Serratia quinivorans]|uniref:hypothetical protein n=1 Tax=Serratia quinivorans TaxID=137545 RepID=UPI003981A328